MNVNTTWAKHKTDLNLLRYFPDSCLKKCPPRDYFWKVFSVVHRADYEYLLATSKTRLNKGMELVITQINIPEETSRMLQNFDSQKSLQTLCLLISWKKAKPL